MADQYSLCLLGVMDHLWFHRVVLLSEATSLLVPKTTKPSQPTSESLTCQSESLSLSSSFDEQVSSPSSEDEQKSSDSSPELDDSNTEAEKKEMSRKERLTRLNLIAGRARSHSSSPTTQKRPKRLRHSGIMSKLQKSMSCRSLWELELEEVKGFMDLGFVFKEEHLNQRMMSVVPGLQRVGLYKNKQITKPDTDAAEIANKDDEKLEQEEYDRRIMRPYLSEAWLIKRSDSPLLNLRMPSVVAAADMKKHLRFWAKTVASSVQQEC